MNEKSKVSIRNIRREANEDLKKKLIEKLISEDQSKNDECNSQILKFIHEKNIEVVDR